MHLMWTSRAAVAGGAVGLALALTMPAAASVTAQEPVTAPTAASAQARAGAADGTAADGSWAAAGFGPRNVIFLIGDGMGYNQVDTASLYQHGVAYHQAAVDPESGQSIPQPGEATQVYQRFPVQLGMATYQHGHHYDPRRAWGSFGWVLNTPPDSAATATALATGVRTYNAAIGVDVGGMPVRNLTERAQELGKASGVVSSVPFTHATPASFVAHNEHRNNYHSIAREMLWEHGVNVVMGGGHPHYGDDAERLAAPSFGYVAEAEYRALAAGETQFRLIQTPAQFTAMATSPNPPEYVFGLPRVGATLQYERSGPDRDRRGDPVEGALPYTAPANAGVPTLSQMTRSALNVLDHASDRGLFLMVEGGAIDWASHDNALNRQIEEQLAFNDAVETVVEWVERTSSWHETLVVVTADHETGYLTGPGSNPAWDPVTGEQGALPDVSWHTGGHTNSLVPLYAKGAGATRLEHYASHEDPVRGAYLENIHPARAVLDFWGTP